MPPLVPVPQATEDRAATDFYDCDGGNKRTLAREVKHSPIKYATMRSARERFDSAGTIKRTAFETSPNNKSSVADPAVYNTDSLSKAGIATLVAESPVKYASAFSATARSFARSANSEAADVQYETDCAAAPSVYTSVEHSERSYATLRSRQRRFGNNRPNTAAPDAIYDTDRGRKRTIVSTVRNSPIKYSSIRSGSRRFHEQNMPATPPSLGPGAYDAAPPMGFQHGKKNERQLSSFASSTGSDRSTGSYDPEKTLGSLFSHERENQVWCKRGPSISQTQLRRPAYIPFDV